jgi:hypothetical protein
VAAVAAENTSTWPWRGSEGGRREREEGKRRECLHRQDDSGRKFSRNF